MKEVGLLLIACLLGVALVFACFGVEPSFQAEEEEIHLTLEKVTAPFDKKAVIEVEQKDGKFKKYAPKDYKNFDKEVDERDLEIVEYHIKDRRIVKIVFGKKKT